MKKILLSLLLAGGVNNSFAMQAGGGTEGGSSAHVVDDSLSQFDKALIDAARSGDLAGVRAQLENGANVNAQTADGLTALMVAAQQGNVEVVQELITKRANLDLPSAYGDTALIYAVLKGHVGVVRALIEGGANVNAQNNVLCITPLINAALIGRADIVRALIAGGANIMVQYADGWTALVEAVVSGHVEVVSELLEQRVVKPNCNYDFQTIQTAINLKDRRGGTALIYAVKNGHLKIVNMLLQYWPDLDAEMDGKSAREWAMEFDTAKGDKNLTLTKAIAMARVLRGL